MEIEDINKQIELLDRDEAETCLNDYLICETLNVLTNQLKQKGKRKTALRNIKKIASYRGWNLKLVDSGLVDRGFNQIAGIRLTNSGE